MTSKRNKKHRVFVGPNDNLGYAMYIARALRAVGIIAHSYSYESSPMSYEIKSDFHDLFFDNKKIKKIEYLYKNRVVIRVFNFLIRIATFIASIFKYDTYIFISPFTFFISNIDLPLLKLLGKKIAVVFLGCGERDPADLINHGDWGYCKICTDYAKQQRCNCNNLKMKRDSFRLIENYSDIIFAEKDLVSFVSGNKNIHSYFVISDPPKNSKALLNKFSSSKVVIAHLPSNSILKGSKYVIDIMSRVAKEIPEIEFITRRMPNKELLDFLEEEVHIVIDELHSPYHGQLAVEAMARGCIVLTRVLDYFYEARPELPIISVNPDTLEGILLKLLGNKPEMIRVAESSIKYYNKYHTLESVGNYYKDKMNL